jgi:hypothetical protein
MVFAASSRLRRVLIGAQAEAYATETPVLLTYYYLAAFHYELHLF